jgi:ATP-binding cassette subfamily G (WHITE) protein 2 (PDR)
MMSPPSQDIENVVAHVYDTAQDTLAPKTLKPDAEDFSSEDWLSSVFQPIQCGALNTCLRSKSGGYAFRDLAVDATTSTDARLETFATVAMSPFRIVAGLLGRKTSLSTALLRDVEGFVNDGEMLAVLGKSGSGCTTLLKVLAGAAKDLQMKEGSEIMYQGMNHLVDEGGPANRT